MAKRHQPNKWAETGQERVESTGMVVTDRPVDDSQSLEEFRTLSLKTLAGMLDTTRSSARRWLREAGIRPIVVGRGRNGAIRYLWSDIKRWLETRSHVT